MKNSIKSAKILANLALGISLQLLSAWSLGKAYRIKCMLRDAKNGHFVYQDKIKKEN